MRQTECSGCGKAIMVPDRKDYICGKCRRLGRKPRGRKYAFNLVVFIMGLLLAYIMFFLAVLLQYKI